MGMVGNMLARLMYASLMWRERRRRATAFIRRGRSGSAQISPRRELGRRGEMLAYWYLRRSGYTMVARNLRLRPGAGELDLVGWDGRVLAFVEVKTRTSDAAGPPESAVTFGQQARIARTAQIYMRRLKQKAVDYRFDIVSVDWDRGAGCQLRLIKDAFKAAGRGQGGDSVARA